MKQKLKAFINHWGSRIVIAVLFAGVGLFILLSQAGERIKLLQSIFTPNVLAALFVIMALVLIGLLIKITRK